MKRIVATILLSTLAAGGGAAGATAPRGHAPVPTAPLLTVVGDSLAVTVYTSTTTYVSPSPVAWPFVAGALLGYEVDDLGVGGTQEPAMITDQVPKIDSKTRCAIYIGGTNDVAFNSWQIPAILPRIGEIANAIKLRAPNATFVMFTTRPYRNGERFAQVQQWNVEVRRVAARVGARVIDLETDPQWLVPADWPDGVHPGEAISKKLGAAAATACSSRGSSKT